MHMGDRHVAGPRDAFHRKKGRSAARIQFAGQRLICTYCKKGNVAVAVRRIMDQPLIRTDLVKGRIAGLRRCVEIDIALFVSIGPVIGKVQRLQVKHILTKRSRKRTM